MILLLFLTLPSPPPDPNFELQILPNFDKAQTELEMEFCNSLSKLCKKNPGHHSFLPITNFTMNDLPISARCDEVMRFIRWDAAESVKLTVCYNSGDKPARFRNNLPADYTRVGSGTVDLNNQSFKHHPAYKPDLSFPIRTAAHVVYNDREAKATRVEFFFDNDDDKSGVIECQGVCVVRVNGDRDWCEFLCEAGDAESARMIRDRIASYRRPTVPRLHGLDVAWTVSYPHGLSQRVTVGKLKDIDETDSYDDLRCNLTRLLRHQCSSLTVGQKEILYVFLKEHRRGIKSYLSRYLSESYKSTLINQALSHLQSKGLVSLSNQLQLQHIMSSMQHLDDHLVSQTNTNHNSQTSTTSWDKTYMKVVSQEVSHLDVDTVDTHLEDQAREVCRELSKTVRNLLFGRHPDTETSTFINKLVYSLHTCPGSSGAAVRALQSCEEGVRWYGGGHSRGGKKNQGNMAGNCAYVLYRYGN